jgi:hypothetical protein
MSSRSLATAKSPAAVAKLFRSMRYEIIPLPSATDCIQSLPPQSLVSVTCSPSRGIPATQRLCESLLALGHTPIPHLAARCVDGPSHAGELAAWVRACGLKEVFIVGGDAPRELHESYSNALPFLSDFLSAKVTHSLLLLLYLCIKLRLQSHVVLCGSLLSVTCRSQRIRNHFPTFHPSS